MPDPYATPRRFPRVKILGNVTGKAFLQEDVTLLDLSEGGALLEHAGRFRLGSICFLRLPGPEGEVLLKGRVVHSAASRTVPDMAGELTLLYHSGVEFVRLTAEALAALRQILVSVGEVPPA